MVVSRTTVLIGAALVASVATVPVAAQDSDPDATVTALQTRVAELEAQVSPTATSGGAATARATDETATGAVGPALPLLPNGEAGKLSVVASGVFQEGSVPVVVRNNTEETVAWIEVSGDVRDANGRVTQTVSGSQFKPLFVGPGGVAIGTVSFGQPVSETDSVSLRAKASDDVSFWESLGGAAVELVEFNDLGDRVTGSIRNLAEITTTDNAFIQIMCFDESGAPTWSESGSADEGIPPGDIAAFEFGRFGGIPVPCADYLFGGYTYAKP